MSENEHSFDRVARELAETSSSTLHLGPNADIVFTVRDNENEPGEKLLHTELVTGQYHKATLKLSLSPILPPDVPWGGGVYAAVAEMWAALNEAINNFTLCRMALDPAINKR